jgi:glycosyltransferase involved in cell wall biosynthesis
LNHLALLIPGLEQMGGAERQLLLLAHGFRRRNVRVSIVALTGTAGDCGTELAQAGIGFYSLQMRKGVADPRGWLRLDGWLRRERPDVLHAHLSHATWMARWSRLLHPHLAVVDTLHSSWTGKLSRRIGYRLSDWLAVTVTAVSVPVAEAHSAAGLVNPLKLSVVPNGVDTVVLRPDAYVRAAVRQELGVGSEFLWLAAGRLVAVKDYPTLLEAMEQLPEDARLVVAGDGPLAAMLHTLSDRLKLGERVRFLGFVPDVGRLFQAADAVVLSSLWEGMPLTLLEAGAYALPAVATRVPGLSQMLVPGETGLLAEAGNPAALAATMSRLMRTAANERLRMGRRARLKVERIYSLEAVLDRWERVYAECRAHAASRPRGELTMDQRIASE